MLVVGLTGGIASGKSAISAEFQNLGVPVIDTDIISRELTRPGTESFGEITTSFGNEVVHESGELDRKKLREIIFSNPEKKAQLEAILHPRILTTVGKQIDALNSTYCVVVIPLLAELGRPTFIDHVLTVESKFETKVKRLMARDNVDRNFASKLIHSQSTPFERTEIADDVVFNDRSLEALKITVANLHKKYELAGQEIEAKNNRVSQD